MKLYYYQAPQGNFGDDLNSWLWEKLLPGFSQMFKDATLSGIGTILNQDMPTSKEWVIFGSGVGYLPSPHGFGGPEWNVLSVRGPLSAKVLDLPSEKAITDGAILVSLLPEYQPSKLSSRQGIVFMPHYKALKYGSWEEICKKAGVEFLDPRSDSKELIKRIRLSKLVLADAMHAAIVADSVRVPWIPITVSSETNSFKWLDWTLSMDLAYKPISLPSSSILETIQDILGSLLGLDYRFCDLSVEQAMNHYTKNLRPRHNAYDRWASFMRGGTLLLLKKIFSLPFLSRIIQKTDKQFQDRAVDQMRFAKSSPAFLSSEDVFLKRQHQMRTILETLRQ